MTDLHHVASRVRQILRPRTRWRELRRRPLAVAPRLPGWPADFDAWTRRGGGRRSGGYPEVWRTVAGLPFPDPARVAVALHAYYPELLPELFDRLRFIPVPYDLYVTNATGGEITLPADLGQLSGATVLDVENQGRDILPLVSLVNAEYLDPYLVVLKVHTKRSQWRDEHDLAGDGERWRNTLLDGLLGSTEAVAEILSAFAERPDLGLVTADGSVLDAEHWGDNEANTANLLRRLELILEPTTLRFAAGSMYWARGFALQGLRALNLTAEDFEPEEGQVNQTTSHAVERLLGVVVKEAGLTIHELTSMPRSVASDSWRRLGAGELRPRARIVPFYLPQFHPFDQNDRWWGRGFTEWTNVSAAQAVFAGHHQPRLPSDLGFYDLRLDEVRRDQQELAELAGISGFMYYHYWFAGTRLMDMPIWRLHKSDLPQPFCIMWANENWTRRWDGREADVLIAQDYEHVAADEFIDDLLPLLNDPRYMTIGQRKILAVYRAGQIPDLPATVRAWRERARQAGAGELYVLNVDVAPEFDGLEDRPEDLGLDGSLGFPPHNHLWHGVPHEGLGVDERFRGNILSYGAMAAEAEQRLRRGGRASHYPGVMVAFDNAARRQWDSDIWYGTNPYTYRRWLAAAVGAVMDREPDDRVVFVNAWNEWAEGAVLEPTHRYGRTFLLATRDVTLA